MCAATPVKPSSESQPGACHVSVWPWVTTGGSELHQVTAALMSQSKLCVCNRVAAEQGLNIMVFLPTWMRKVKCKHLYHCSLTRSCRKASWHTKILKAFVFAIPKEVQNSPSPSPSIILWFCGCRHHQIEFGWDYFRAAWAVLCYPAIHVLSCIILSFCECQQTECICLEY